jgi:hypothetical protein
MYGHQSPGATGNQMEFLQKTLKKGVLCKKKRYSSPSLFSTCLINLLDFTFLLWNGVLFSPYRWCNGNFTEQNMQNIHLSHLEQVGNGRNVADHNHR